MGKDPAFLFYPGDWIQGTLLMSFEQKGAFHHLLCIQFSNGKLTENDIKKTLGKAYRRLWSSIKSKFKFDGKYYWNERLEDEKNKRRNFTESRKKNLQGKRKKTKTHMDSHMENRNGNRNRNRDRDVNDLKKSVGEIKKNSSEFNYITSGDHESYS